MTNFFVLSFMIFSMSVMAKEVSITEEYLHQIALKGSPNLDQMKPVMATSLTTMGGLFPTAYGVGGEDAMLVPITLAMAWGLTTGTILTLIWIPSGYAIIEDMMNLIRKIK